MNSPEASRLPGENKEQLKNQQVQTLTAGEELSIKNAEGYPTAVEVVEGGVTAVQISPGLRIEVTRHTGEATGASSVSGLDQIGKVGTRVRLIPTVNDPNARKYTEIPIQNYETPEEAVKRATDQLMDQARSMGVKLNENISVASARQDWVNLDPDHIGFLIGPEGGELDFARIDIEHESGRSSIPDSWQHALNSDANVSRSSLKISVEPSPEASGHQLGHTEYYGEVDQYHPYGSGALNISTQSSSNPATVTHIAHSS